LGLTQFVDRIVVEARDWRGARSFVACKTDNDGSAPRGWILRYQAFLATMMIKRERLIF
jgi:hypothetical protein